LNPSLSCISINRLKRIVASVAKIIVAEQALSDFSAPIAAWFNSLIHEVLPFTCPDVDDKGRGEEDGQLVALNP